MVADFSIQIYATVTRLKTHIILHRAHLLEQSWRHSACQKWGH